MELVPSLPKRIDQSLAIHTLVDGYRSKDAIERANAQRVVIGHRQPLMAWHLSLQDDVATLLVY